MAHAETMTAIAIREPGGPDVLIPEDRPVPIPGEQELLVAVTAAGVNRPDVMQRKGQYAPPPGASDIPGLEISGLVARCGNGVTRFKEGDQVVALVPGGGYAEFCTVHETNALPLPEGLTLVEGAGLPETTFTVWHNVFQRGALRPGEWLLVHGGTSGIGTTAIQLAKAFGAFVVATAGSEEKCARHEAARRRRGGQLQDHRFRRGGARRHRRRRRRRDPRHGGRRLSRPQPDGRGRGGAHRADLHARRRADEDRPAQGDEQAAHADRLDAAQPPGRLQGASSRAPSRRRYGRSSRSAATSRSSTGCFRSRKRWRRTGASTAASTSARSS